MESSFRVDMGGMALSFKVGMALTSGLRMGLSFLVGMDGMALSF